MRLATMVMCLVGLVMFGTGCAGGIERTNGHPVKVIIEECSNTEVNVEVNARDQSGDMPKTVSTVPTVSAAASESGTASTEATPNANVTNQPAAK